MSNAIPLLQWMQSHIDPMIMAEDMPTHSKIIKPRIHCADGFTISVQAHEGAYCHPRVNYADWTQVECGFPNGVPERIMHRAEDPVRPTDTVYGYCDIDEVAELLADHGGIDFEKSPWGKFAKT